MEQPPTVPATQGAPAAAPVVVELEAPLEVARWRPLVHWLLVIPHAFILWFLMIGFGICSFIGFFAVLFTKKIPSGMHDFMTMVLRYQWRVSTYYLFMREDYPPFDFESVAQDQEEDPARLSVLYAEEQNRWLPLVKWLLAIPHYFVLVFLYIGAFFAILGAFFAVLFTGKYPEGIRKFVVGLTRWQMRLQVYVYFLRDEYPPFSLD